MTAVSTNTISVAVVDESSLGVAGTSGWSLVEVNNPTAIGAELTIVPRAPITKDRQRRKGEIVDLDSTFEFEADLTQEHLLRLVEGAWHSRTNGPGLLADGYPYYPTSVTTTAYVVATGGTLPQNTLIKARGFAVAGNNGLKVVGAASDDDEIKTSGLAAETTTVPQNATVEVCGRQGASGDLQIDGSGNLISSALDFTTLGLTRYQWIKIGGATGGALVFATAAYNGYARITLIEANKLTLDRRTWTVGAADAGAAKTIQIFFGRFARQVSIDDADYLERTYTFEVAYPDLDGGTDAYEYPAGNRINEMALNINLTDKATMTVAAIGTDTPIPTTSRKTGADSARNPVQTSAYNTSSDFARLRIATTGEVDLSTKFKSLTFTIRNNVSAEKVLGTLGAARINTGLQEIDIDAQVWFDDPDIASAVRDNTTVVIDCLLKNDDAGFYLDVPAATLGDGSHDFPVNETVLINLAGQAHKDTTTGFSGTISFFPHLP